MIPLLLSWYFVVGIFLTGEAVRQSGLSDCSNRHLLFPQSV